MSEQPVVKAVNPSYWWWVLSVLVGIIGGLIAWGVNRPKHPYMAKAMLLVGILSSLLYAIVAAR